MSDVNNPENAFSDSMFVVDITLGIGIDRPSITHWGYCSEEASENEMLDTMPAVGALTVVKNKTDITRADIFYWIEYPNNVDTPKLIWNLYSHKDNDSYNRLVTLFEKNLYITVDGVTYALGKRVGSIHNNPEKHRVNNWYKDSADVQKLSYILKQTGVTKRLHINWK
ncbi:DUF7823 domain-containing protein [Xenorhabdus stockiae]|uniref:DUF7823 domain-containing protein n=1 Tax=Xenorhabdus stockiae TaxID=351614 RepID=UPI0040630821